MLKTLVDHIENIMLEKSKRKFLLSRISDMKITHADISKANKLLNWRPKTNIQSGLVKTKEYFFHGK